jgi:hypothetical protein
MLNILVKIFLKSSIFWDITQYSPLKVNRIFRGTADYLLPFFMLVSWEAYSSTLMMEEIRFSETSVGFQLHGVVSQKIQFFIITAVRTSNPTKMFLTVFRDKFKHRSSCTFY